MQMFPKDRPPETVFLLRHWVLCEIISLSKGVSIMAREIEEKYLITSDSWRPLVDETTTISQTYLIGTRTITIRTRIESNRPAVLCIKLAERADGTPEYEWPIPRWVARICSRLHSRSLSKHRHRIAWEGLTIEVDEFLGRLAGLIVAEVELPTYDHQYTKPDWFGSNVTTDTRYKNARLVKNGLPT